MMHYAFEECKGPVAIRYPRGTVRCENAAPELPVNRSYLKRDGSDVLMIAVGTVVYDALDAADRLGKDGIRAAVLDVRCIKPLDTEALLRHSDGKKVIAVLEDNVITGGLGEQVAALLGRRVLCFAYPDEPIVQGTVSQLKEKYGLTAEKIAAKLMAEMKKDGEV